MLRKRRSPVPAIRRGALAALVVFGFSEVLFVVMDWAVRAVLTALGLGELVRVMGS